MNTQLARRIGFTAWAALALLQIVWHAWLLPPQRMPVAVALAIALIPLALPLLYWRMPLRVLIAAGMVSLFYFCHGVTEAWSVPAERLLAWIEIVLAVVLVLSCARKPRKRAAVAIPSPSGVRDGDCELLGAVRADSNARTQATAGGCLARNEPGNGWRAAPGEGTVLGDTASPDSSGSLHRDDSVPSPQPLSVRERGSNQESS